MLELKTRNDVLFLFGLICLLLALLFFVLARTTGIEVFGVNAWLKPLKFALSLGIYSWTMAWYCYYLPDFNVKLFNWTVVVMWSFELLYIALQAGKGELSHFNISTPVYSVLYILMALAASVVTLYTAYVGWLFFTNEFSDLPEYYVWAIRFGILWFVVFSFEGFAMGSRLSHTVGALNDNSNWFIIGWSRTVGDLRISHFIGLHALQVLPLLSYYVLKNTRLTLGISLVYGLLAAITLIQALNGKPLFKAKSEVLDYNSQIEKDKV